MWPSYDIAGVPGYSYAEVALVCFAAASSEQAAPLVGFGTRDRQSIFWDDNSSEL